MRVIGGNEIPKELKDALFELGKSRKLVLLEGRDDKAVLNEWFEDKSSKLLFYQAGSCEKVKEYLEYISKKSRNKRYFGIIDRDFKNDEDVNYVYQDEYEKNIFIWKKYCIENYLLNEKAVLKELDKAYTVGETKHGVKDEKEMQGILLEIFKDTKYIMAGNWTIKELGNRQTYIGVGVENNKDKVLSIIKGKYKEAHRYFKWVV